ncbi:phage minor capsid protein [Cytobacillus solani]|uniref:Type IV secretion protein Rhs n=1 Tax=Cytobacillus solani TaxID=1637975 RepID=A0A0Q3QLI1_9BACI|nr:phage minor capsid protein [Cytobacillus solani]KQL18849.1 type IV secretion protein Rhs [Cytobacillus solani]
MANFREIPSPTYDYEIRKLVRYYEDALQSINLELMRFDLTNMQRANILALQADVAAILKELNGKSSDWITRYIPEAATDGIARTILSLGVAETLDEARAIAKFNRLNRELVKAAVADTQADLLQVTQNVDRRVRTAIRQVTGEVLRYNLTQGINATQSLKQGIMRDLRTRLGESLNTGIVDAANRRWKPHVYVEMVVRTKMASAQREAAINEGVANEAYYGVISRHGAKDMCRVWEGRVISLVPNAPGDFPYIGDLPRRDIFHPNCRHLVTPFRRLDNLPEDLRELNGI